MSILFIIAVIKAVKQHRVSRKCYVLIINRSIGDALSCLMANILTVYVITKDVPNKNVIHIFENFFIASFWSGMISYVSLSVLKLFAVARPFHYRNTVTMKSCIYLVIGSWIVFLIVLSYALGATALTRIPFLQQWSQCKVETCLRMMYRIRNLFVIGIYCFTLVCFILTVIYVHRAKKFVETFQNSQKAKQKSSRLKFPLWKLALNVATFALFNLAYVGIIITFIILAGSDKCFSLRNYPTMMQIFGIIRLGLMARIIVDPIISFFTDIQVSGKFA
uniref:G-protein coupled receptors family 1 profile domain-containing protein n=1 Tax=Panagrolaimus superbus TaxID=310955 RepID=A0A914Y831_9BILA